MCESSSEVLYLALLLLLAKGYTITRGRLPISSSIKLTIFMCLYVITYVTLFLYEKTVSFSGSKIYLKKEWMTFYLESLIWVPGIEDKIEK